jgi:hypothetical protein
MKTRVTGTQKQYDALARVAERWQHHTPQHEIMPDGFLIVPESEYREGDHIGVWVGPECDGKPGSMYLGIEYDGYTHS